MIEIDNETLEQMLWCSEHKYLYKMSHYLQNILWFLGIAWHNSKAGECTKDFNCCEDIGRKAFVKFKQRKAK